MATAARILTVTSVGDVPAADSLSVVRILGYDAVTAKNPDGSHAFTPGERVVYVPEGSRLPESLLRMHGFWQPHPATGEMRGSLSGADGDVIKPVTLRGQLSTGLVWKLPSDLSDLPDMSDVSAHFGITEYVPPVPNELADVAMPLVDARFDYRIARLPTYPDLLAGEEVVVTEKIHGECIQLTWLGDRKVSGAHHDGRIAIATKLMGYRGIVFRDVPETETVGVVRAVRASGLLDAFERAVRSMGMTGGKVRLFAEAAGPGVQRKFHYGAAAPFARAIDIHHDHRWLTEDERAAVFADSSIERVPILWRGIYDEAVIEALRDGACGFGGTLREGVVVTTTGDQKARLTSLGDHVRPCLKTHSERFLRKFGREV